MSMTPEDMRALAEARGTAAAPAPVAPGTVQSSGPLMEIPAEDASDVR